MKSKDENNKLNSIQIANELDNILAKGGEIDRKIILEAEDINYNSSQNEIESYDEFGFLDKHEDEEEKK